MADFEMQPPTQCHLWQAATLQPPDIDEALEWIETWVSEGHHSKHLCRCKTCGQLYVGVWCELIDWDGGDDTTFSFYIPVRSAADMELVRHAAPPPMELDLLAFHPRINETWEHGARKVAWIGKP